MRLDTWSFSKIAKYILIGYVFLSVVYTVKHFYSSQSTHRAYVSGESASILPRNREDIRAASFGSNDMASKNEAQVVWSSSEGTVQSMQESFLMSKIFSDAMGPSNLSPYYLRAQQPFENEDITMATLVTRDRFKVLSRLASHYKGPISAAIHVNDDDSKQDVMSELEKIYASNPDMIQYVDIHLIVDRYDRQFNMWRNVAKFFARTDYIMMLDVDFYLCTDFRQRIRNSPEIMEKLREGKTALVVPAFEYIIQEDGNDWRTFPTSKTELLQEVENQKLDMFHKSWLKGHGSTNYTKWYESSELYKVTQYDFSYEPYIIYKKEGSPWCDERFIGYGANKAACLYEIYLSGIDYWVLPHDFLIHQTHKYPESTRRKERQYNRKLYSNFREELCLRYARMFIARGEWETPISDNLRNECHKIRGFRQTMKSPVDDA
ncbi:hypothetical protein EC973_009330 [Apophysomyces ossiformis]|uniref:Glycosyltransferase family 49 protein n=1 Tax=Apophysomyces ossiformis TaxID=679940 RepID=A0A8H7BVE3_9FUNG|nr:hypothetical protein EC973_009330 [Apophysomyces ossiformis]